MQESRPAEAEVEVSTAGRCFFVLSCARSGSTSLAQILDSAANGRCQIEPSPNLNRETRLMMDGRFADPVRLLEETVVPRVRANLAEVEIYGEKNVTYGPFIPYLYELLDCRFVYLKRDPRDIVRSLMDWHEQMFGSVYRECRDSGRLSPRAISAAAQLPVHHDTSDYARPRPRPGDPYFARWEHLSREEMSAYYVAVMEELYERQLSQLPDSAWVEIDYSQPTTDDVLRVAEFLGLSGIEPERVEEMLGMRINSLQSRTGQASSYPHWTNWDSGLRDRFTAIAGATMRRSGRFTDPQTNWRPQIDFGRFWCEQQGGLEWYEWMYDGRRKMHEDMITWVGDPARSEEIRSIADFGCGVGVGYCDAFADRHYVGIDLSPQNIRWCHQHRSNPKHEYRCLDFVSNPPDPQFDLVFSSGTIDNCYDVDAFLRAMVHASHGWIYLTCYRGWFPELEQHVYCYNPEQGCFYNDVSPLRAQETLLAAGCRDVVIEPVVTGRTDIPYETRIIARSPKQEL